MGTNATGIQYSEAACCDLAPSRLARRFVEAAALATLALFVLSPIDAAIQLAVLAWLAVVTRRALARAAWRGRVEVDRHRAIRVRDAAGVREGLVQDATVAFPFLTVIRWRPPGAWTDRTVLVLPDMLDPAAFRHLRVVLRTGSACPT